MFHRRNLCKGFWQIPREEAYEVHMAFVAPIEAYGCNRLPFGWKNNVSWFQKVMNGVLRPFPGFFLNQVHLPVRFLQV